MTPSKKTAMNNHEVSSRFFTGIISVLSKRTSRSYSLVVLASLKKDLSRKFRFFEYISINEKKIGIDIQINKVNEAMLGKMFMRIIDILGQSLLKARIQEELDKKTVKCLVNMGVTF